MTKRERTNATRARLAILRNAYPRYEFRSRRIGDLRCIEYRDDPDCAPGCDPTWLFWEEIE